MPNRSSHTTTPNRKHSTRQVMVRKAYTIPSQGLNTHRTALPWDLERLLHLTRRLVNKSRI